MKLDLDLELTLNWALTRIMFSHLKSTTQSKKNRSHTCTKGYSGSANFLPTSTVKRETSFYWFPENKLQIWRVHATQPIPLVTDPRTFYTPLRTIEKNLKKSAHAPGFPAKKISSCLPRDLIEKTTSWICSGTLVNCSCNLLTETQMWLPFELVEHVTHHVYY